MDDPWKDPGAEKFIDHVIDELAPKVRESALVISLLPTDRGEAKFWVELGCSIMLGKPLILVALPGREIPPKLALIVDAIIRADEPDEKMARNVTRAVQRVMRDHGIQEM